MDINVSSLLLTCTKINIRTSLIIKYKKHISWLLWLSLSITIAINFPFNVYKYCFCSGCGKLSHCPPHLSIAIDWWQYYISVIKSRDYNYASHFQWYYQPISSNPLNINSAFRRPELVWGQLPSRLDYCNKIVLYGWIRFLWSCIYINVIQLTIQFFFNLTISVSLAIS